uniref:F-box domain-containing protein n=1 Tax=Craspedostauros australis TaxID=1486917 RepID=A0A7S0F4Q0_9STRA
MHGPPPPHMMVRPPHMTGQMPYSPMGMHSMATPNRAYPSHHMYHAPSSGSKRPRSAKSEHTMMAPVHGLDHHRQLQHATASVAAKITPHSTATSAKRMALRQPSAVRLQFDPQSARKKRKLTDGGDEVASSFFGRHLPKQTKTTALAIFSYLSNADVYNASLVSKKWSNLAIDGELWKFT